MTSTVKLKGNPVTVLGNFPEGRTKGSGLQPGGQGLKDVSLNEFAGKRKVLNIVPSLDTAVCADVDAQVQRGGRQA